MSMETDVKNQRRQLFEWMSLIVDSIDQVIFDL